jgi:RecJ-like exonuclease
MYKSECTKCMGKGHIRAYDHVAGGICFTCNGKGYIETKTKPVESKLFPITAVDNENDQRIIVFHIKAKSEKEALEKAAKRIDNCKGYIHGTSALATQEELNRLGAN